MTFSGHLTFISWIAWVLNQDAKAEPARTALCFTGGLTQPSSYPLKPGPGGLLGEQYCCPELLRKDDVCAQGVSKSNYDTGPPEITWDLARFVMVATCQ